MDSEGGFVIEGDSRTWCQGSEEGFVIEWGTAGHGFSFFEEGFASEMGTACCWLGSCLCSLQQGECAGALDMCRAAEVLRRLAGPVAAQIGRDGR